MIKDSLDKMEQLLCQFITYIISYWFYVVFSKIRYFNVNLKSGKDFHKNPKLLPLREKYFPPHFCRFRCEILYLKGNRLKLAFRKYYSFF